MSGSGAGRGFGRAISAALVAAGTGVVGIARDRQECPGGGPAQSLPASAADLRIASGSSAASVAVGVSRILR